METVDGGGDFFLQYGGLCVVDCARLLPLEGGLEPEEFGNWFAAQAMVMLLDEQRSVTAEAFVRAVPEGLGWGELEVVSGDVFVGSTEMLLGEGPLDPDQPGEGVVIHVPPGSYRVGIEATGERHFVVYLEAVDAHTGVADGDLTPWASGGPSAPSPSASRPILSQLSMTAERLGGWLQEAGQVLRLAQDLALPVRLEGADVGPILSERLPDDVDEFLRRRSWSFRDDTTDGEVRFVHSENERLVLRVTLQGALVVDASLASPAPTSQQDRDEVLSLVSAAFAADALPGRSVRAVPIASAEPTEPRAEPVLQWGNDKLTIRLARPELPRPLLRVTFFDGPQPVEQSEVRPLYLREGAWLYEVWLVGPREGLSVAQVHLV